MNRTRPDGTASAAVSTPLGKLRLAASARGLCRIGFPHERLGSGNQRGSCSTASQAKAARHHLATVARQFREYFSGRRRRFDLLLDLAGTPSEERVWKALLRIPFGRTLSYGGLAVKLGRPRAARAVGRACARNPIPIVIPCHRVIGADSGLHGYGGGLWRKRLLLSLEGNKEKAASGRSKRART